MNELLNFESYLEQRLMTFPLPVTTKRKNTSPELEGKKVFTDWSFLSVYFKQDIWIILLYRFGKSLWNSLFLTFDTIVSLSIQN